MKGTIFSKLTLCFFIALFSIFILLNNFGYQMVNKKIVDKKIEYLYKEANTISSQYMTGYYSLSMDNQSLSSQLRAIEVFTNVRIWLIDSSGIIIADSGSTKNATDVNINSFDPNFLHQSISLNTVYASFFDEPMLSLIQPVSYNYRVRGYIALHIPWSEIHAETLFYIDIFNIIFLFFAVVLLIIFAYIYYTTINPVKRLIRAAIEYSATNYDYKINISFPREYAQLADAITYMANELGGLEDYQRKFVANISHDFRSPLTSIKGYAEAILDGTIPYEMQDKYINIILFETERLNKLTSSLLELNNMETRGIYLDISTFDINSTIKKVAESFEGICNEKKISFNLTFSAKITYVEADISKIQQVLYNLVDNAIKFSPVNSIIKIFSDVKGDKVFITVKDYGVGINKNSINKIWDRFYKTDTSRGKDKKGTGLGLSITKEIIQAHNENISIVSTEGVGTEFVFTLPKSNNA